MMRAATLSFLLLVARSLSGQNLELAGHVTDPQGRAAPGARVHLMRNGLDLGLAVSDAVGAYSFRGVAPGTYTVTAEAAGFERVARNLEFPTVNSNGDLQFQKLHGQSQSLVVTANTLEPSIDLRNSEVFNRALFSRDDQIFQQLDAGIDAGQHEGGGKSLEIRRFGFNLDHGGVGGGLKVLLDGVQQNQGTQGHGQGYLGSLKALSPELIQDATVINGPFSAEYGDFSGLGVVHIRQREALGDEYTVRLEGGQFDTARGFFAWSPSTAKRDAYIAYDGSYANGPFLNAGRYRRDNINGNYSRALSEREKLGFRVLYGRNRFRSSGQLPLDLVESGQLDRFGYIDPTDGGRAWLGTASTYYSRTMANGDTLRVDGFTGRSLFDLFSNFTFYLNDPVAGDAFQQHDSRLQEGANIQYQHLQTWQKGVSGRLVAGGNFHDNHINVGLYPRVGDVPLGVTTRAFAAVTNPAGYAHETLSFWSGRLLVGGGLRYDAFRYGVADQVAPEYDGAHWAARWQGKGNAALRPLKKLPLTLHANYGRGINSADARGVAQRPSQPRLATTDFYQTGVSSSFGRASFAGDVFLIDHSNEQVYVPDDGSFEFKGPSRSYGFETKASVALTRHLSFSAGVTKVSNAFYRGGDHRVYVDSAPHFVSNAAMVVAPWHGWSGSVRMRAINHYRLDGEDPEITAQGHTVFDVNVAKQVRRHVQMSLAVNNALNRRYYETQNYFESRVRPDAPAVTRVHGTPAYPLTVVLGVGFRFGAR